MRDKNGGNRKPQRSGCEGWGWALGGRNSAIDVEREKWGLVSCTAILMTIGEWGGQGGWLGGCGVVDTAIGEAMGFDGFGALTGVELVGDAAIGELHRGKILFVGGLTGLIIANLTVVASDAVPCAVVIVGTVRGEGDRAATVTALTIIVLDENCDFDLRLDVSPLFSCEMLNLPWMGRLDDGNWRDKAIKLY